jgi:hypothetical protein
MTCGYVLFDSSRCVCQCTPYLGEEQRRHKYLNVHYWITCFVAKYIITVYYSNARHCQTILNLESSRTQLNRRAKICKIRSRLTLDRARGDAALCSRDFQVSRVSASGSTHFKGCNDLIVAGVVENAQSTQMICTAFSKAATSYVLLYLNVLHQIIT